MMNDNDPLGSVLTDTDSLLLATGSLQSVLEDNDLRSLVPLQKAVVKEGLALRQKIKLPVKQPLAEMCVQVTAEEDQLLSYWTDPIEQELNVEKVWVDMLPYADLGWVSRTTPRFTVWLDTVITPSLARKGAAREIGRAGQNERKNLGMTMADRVHLWMSRECYDLLEDQVVTVRTTLQVDSILFDSIPASLSEFSVKTSIGTFAMALTRVD